MNMSVNSSVPVMCKGFFKFSINSIINDYVEETYWHRFSLAICFEYILYTVLFAKKRVFQIKRDFRFISFGLQLLF